MLLLNICVKPKLKHISNRTNARTHKSNLQLDVAKDTTTAFKQDVYLIRVLRNSSSSIEHGLIYNLRMTQKNDRCVGRMSWPHWLFITGS